MKWSNRSLTGITKTKKRENPGQIILAEIMAEKFQYLKHLSPLL